MLFELTEKDGLWKKIRSHIGTTVKHPVSPATPDSPINAGTLCPKGSAGFGLHVSPYRWTKVRYRRPYSTEWEDLTLEEALSMIAERVKKTRDENWQDRDERGKKLSRSTAVASIGGATIDNEENYLITKLFHSLGFLRITNQARI